MEQQHQCSSAVRAARRQIVPLYNLAVVIALDGGQPRGERRNQESEVSTSVYISYGDTSIREVTMLFFPREFRSTRADFMYIMCVLDRIGARTNRLSM